MIRTLRWARQSEFFWLFLSIFIFIGVAALTASCTETKTVEVERIIEKIVPAEINLDRFPKAKEYLVEEISNCGGGVVSNAKLKEGEKPLPNRCEYTFAVDQEFLLDHQNHTGLIIEDDQYTQAGATFYEPTFREYSQDYDLRTYAKNGLNIPKQQQCGDCWAWSTHHALEIFEAVHYGVLDDRSVQTVLSCSGYGTCGGGTMSTPLYLAEHGVPGESEFPYKNGVTGICKFSKTEQNWEPKALSVPYVGSSMMHSRGALTAAQRQDGDKVAMMKTAIEKNKAPLVVTVKAYSMDGPGVYDNTSAINSGGDHMVDVIGWDGPNAHVYNSWGPEHGENGISRILWEDGPGRLNRGLGRSARVVLYRPACKLPDVSFAQAGFTIISGSAVKIGKAQPANHKCSWTPTTGLDNPTACETYAAPLHATEYHLTVTNDCEGKASAMQTIRVLSDAVKTAQVGRTAVGFAQLIETPFGYIKEIKVNKTTVYEALPGTIVTYR